MARIYLAWQTYATGKKMIRRWSPDLVATTKPPHKLHGEEYRYTNIGFDTVKNKSAMRWLSEAGNPSWPECLYADTLPRREYATLCIKKLLPRQIESLDVSKQDDAQGAAA